jgi:hypothetical protein
MRTAVYFKTFKDNPLVQEALYGEKGLTDCTDIETSVDLARYVKIGVNLTSAERTKILGEELQKFTPEERKKLTKEDREALLAERINQIREDKLSQLTEEQIVALIEKQGLTQMVKNDLMLDSKDQKLQKEFAQNYGYDENQVCSPVGAVVGCTEEQDAINLRNQYPNIFFLIPGYGAQGGKAKIAGTLLGKAGGTVNSSRGVLCAWKKDEALTEKRESGILTLDDIVGAAEKVALASKTELLEMAGKYSV